MTDDAPRLHIDADWKEQAQAEKEKLSQQIDDTERQPGPDELPPASMHALVSMLASQAIMGLGGYADPQTGRPMIDLVGSRFAIDVLGVLHEKTTGNLTPEETAELTEVLAALRQRFVQVATLIQQQMAKDPSSVTVVGGPGQPAGDAPKGGPRLVIPE